MLLKAHCTLNSRMSSTFKKLLKNKRLSFRIIKKICFLLSKFRIIDPNWLLKPIRTIEANNVDLGLMINVSINGHTVRCILDTGSTFTLIPFKIFKLLNLNPTLPSYWILQLPTI